MKQAFTLIEAIITVVILGILVTFAMPAYRVTQERALDKEAKANLKLIRAGERIYRIETDNSIYISCTGPSAVDCINSNLKLSIPTGTPNWNYKVDNVTATTFTGKAQRVTDSRVWCINQATDEPYQGCSWN